MGFLVDILVQRVLKGPLPLAIGDNFCCGPNALLEVVDIFQLQHVQMKMRPRTLDANSARQTCGIFVEMRPSTRLLWGGKYFSGSNVPARPVSYSSYTRIRGWSREQDRTTHIVGIDIQMIEQFDRYAIVTAFGEVPPLLQN